MNKQETAEFLTVASAVDNRIVNVETVEAWHVIIGYLSLPVALDALKLHFTESTDYLLPAHIVANARRVQADIDRLRRLSAQTDWQIEAAEARSRAVSPPTCKHDISLMKCLPCMKELADKEK